MTTMSAVAGSGRGVGWTKGISTVERHAELVWKCTSASSHVSFVGRVERRCVFHCQYRITPSPPIFDVTLTLPPHSFTSTSHHSSSTLLCLDPQRPKTPRPHIQLRPRPTRHTTLSLLASTATRRQNAGQHIATLRLDLFIMFSSLYVYE